MKSKCCNSKAIKQDAGNYFCSNCIRICETKRNCNIFSIFLLLLVTLISLQSFAPNDKNKHRVVKVNYKDSTDVKLIDSCIYFELKAQGAYFPEIGLKQYIQETGRNSTILKQNNLFGLKCYCKYSKGFKNGHSYYQSRKDCIKCYVAFTNRYWEKYTANYAEDSNYLTKLTKI